MVHTQEIAGQLSFKSSSSLFICEYQFLQCLCYKNSKFHEVTTNLLCVTVIQRHRGELKWNPHVAWQHVVSGEFQCVRHVFMFKLSLKLLIVFMKDEGKLWVKEEDVVTSHFWTILFAPRATPFLQKFTGMSAVQTVVSLSTCTDVMMWSTMLGWKKKEAKTTSEEKQEAEFVARVYRGDIHVAVVARASKTRSVWCGFNEIHHKILHCGFMVCV